MSISTALTALADAIRSKSGTSDKLTIAAMTTAVNNITIEADVDLEGVNVTADKILSPYIAVDGSGAKITGTIQTVKASSNGTTVTVPVGYIAVEQTFDVGSSDGDANVEFGYVTEDGTVQMLDLSGETPVDSGEVQTLEAVLFATGQDEPVYPGTGGGYSEADVVKYLLVFG